MTLELAFVSAISQDIPDEHRKWAECFRRADHAWMIRQPRLARKYLVPYQILTYKFFNKDFDYTEELVDELHFRTTTLDFLGAIFYIEHFKNSTTFMRTTAYVDAPCEDLALQSLLRNGIAPDPVGFEFEGSSIAASEGPSTSAVLTSEPVFTRDVSGKRIYTTAPPPPAPRVLFGTTSTDLPTLNTYSSRRHDLHLSNISDVAPSLLNNEQVVTVHTIGECNCSTSLKLVELNSHRTMAEPPLQYVIVNSCDNDAATSFFSSTWCYDASTDWPSHIPFILITTNLLHGYAAYRTFVLSRHSRLSCLGANVAGDRVSLEIAHLSILQHAF